jgi:hypothetical protein
MARMGVGEEDGGRPIMREGGGREDVGVQNWHKHGSRVRIPSRVACAHVTAEFELQP